MEEDRKQNGGHEGKRMDTHGTYRNKCENNEEHLGNMWENWGK